MADAGFRTPDKEQSSWLLVAFAIVLVGLASCGSAPVRLKSAGCLEQFSLGHRVSPMCGATFGMAF